jgi:hypothetical protein
MPAAQRGAPAGPPPSPPPDSAPEHRHTVDQLYAIYLAVAAAALVFLALVVWATLRHAAAHRRPSTVAAARIRLQASERRERRVDTSSQRAAVYMPPVAASLLMSLAGSRTSTQLGSGPMSEGSLHATRGGSVPLHMELEVHDASAEQGTSTGGMQLASSSTSCGQEQRAKDVRRTGRSRSSKKPVEVSIGTLAELEGPVTDGVV